LPLDLPLGELPSEGLLNEIFLKKGASQQSFTNVRYGQRGVDTGVVVRRGPVFPFERRLSTQRYHSGHYILTDIDQLFVP
jgi:hypothetical protein